MFMSLVLCHWSFVLVPFVPCLALKGLSLSQQAEKLRDNVILRSRRRRRISQCRIFRARFFASLRMTGQERSPSDSLSDSLYTCEFSKVVFDAFPTTVSPGIHTTRTTEARTRDQGQMTTD